jgi:aldoxime dehydratase
MVFHVEYERTIAPRKPTGHTPAAQRYSLRWKDPVSAIISDYFAIQQTDLSREREKAFFERVLSSFNNTQDGPDSHEMMRTTDEGGETNSVVVGYWRDPVKHARFCLSAPLIDWFDDKARLNEPFGLWRETISVPYDRHETIYSEEWYRIGIGRTANSVLVPITTNGFFGAARDRIPLSAIDKLESPFQVSPPRTPNNETKGRRIRVGIPFNMVTLRSGQYWAHAGQEQLEDYTQNMRPRLMTGMNFLLDNKEETGTLALRVLTNLDEQGNEQRETSILAHFISLQHLEDWAASHKTHLDIYRHAIAMNHKYKKEREFVSWHELFVSQSACFEYVNCHPNSGLLPYAGVPGFYGAVVPASDAVS